MALIRALTASSGGGDLNQAEFLTINSGYTFTKDYASVTLTTWDNSSTNYANYAKIDGESPDLADVRSIGGLYLSTAVFLNVKKNSVFTSQYSFVVYGASY